MIDAATVGEIVEQYKKHGWTLRRALFTDDGRKAAAGILPTEFLYDSDFDALWFSRRSKPDTEAWELRRVTGAPFALIAVVSTGDDVEELEAALANIEDEMRERTLA